MAVHTVLAVCSWAVGGALARMARRALCGFVFSIVASVCNKVFIHRFWESGMRLAVLPGDDIGPEITEAALTVLNAVDRAFSLGLVYEVHEVGMKAHKRCGTTLPDTALRAVREVDGIVLGPGGMTSYPPAPAGGITIPGPIRKNLALYATILPPAP